MLSHSYQLFAPTTGGWRSFTGGVIVLDFEVSDPAVVGDFTCHSQFLRSLHPQRIISPLRETLQPVL